VVEELWKYWLFDNKKSVFVVHTNDIYNKSINDRAWVTSNVFNTWHITRGGEQCSKVLDKRWESHLPLNAKVFLWCVMVGGLPLAMTLKQRHISSGTCVFSAMIYENTRHRFTSCHVVKAIWIVMSQLWGSFI
jgi:hypothetical protein